MALMGNFASNPMKHIRNTNKNPAMLDFKHFGTGEAAHDSAICQTSRSSAPKLPTARAELRHCASALLCICWDARLTARISIPPIGFSTAGYCGHIFWDAAAFRLPTLMALDPTMVKSLVMSGIALSTHLAATPGGHVNSGPRVLGRPVRTQPKRRHVLRTRQRDIALMWQYGSGSRRP